MSHYLVHASYNIDVKMVVLIAEVYDAPDCGGILLVGTLDNCGFCQLANAQGIP